MNLHRFPQETVLTDDDLLDVLDDYAWYLWRDLDFDKNAKKRRREGGVAKP